MSSVSDKGEKATQPNISLHPYIPESKLNIHSNIKQLTSNYK